MQFSNDIERVFGNLRGDFPDRTRAEVSLEADDVLVDRIRMG